MEDRSRKGFDLEIQQHFANVEEKSKTETAAEFKYDETKAKLKKQILKRLRKLPRVTQLIISIARVYTPVFRLQI